MLIRFAMAISINSGKLCESCPSKINTCGRSGHMFLSKVSWNHNFAIPCFDTLQLVPYGVL